ncbi:MAG TPA: hypothetical protein DCQ31_17640 [Bacteroidales bacterium]|nr:hypothetical protein [Bacteroidales bacterium]
MRFQSINPVYAMVKLFMLFVEEFFIPTGFNIAATVCTTFSSAISKLKNCLSDYLIVFSEFKFSKTLFAHGYF